VHAVEFHRATGDDHTEHDRADETGAQLVIGHVGAWLNCACLHRHRFRFELAAQRGGTRCRCSVPCPSSGFPRRLTAIAAGRSANPLLSDPRSAAIKALWRWCDDDADGG
jgi:hypothetical protein